MSSKSLKTNISWSLIGNGVFAGCQWLAWVILGNIALPSEIGRFALGLAINTPVFALCLMQLRVVIASDTEREYAFEAYLGLRLVSILLAVIFIVILSTTIHLSPDSLEAVLIISLYKCIESLSDVYYGYMHQRERLDLIAKSNIVRGPAYLIAIAGGYLVFGNLESALTTLVLMWAAIFILVDLKFMADLRISEHSKCNTKPAKIKPQFNRKFLASIALTSLPLGLVMSVVALNANAPRYIVRYFYGESGLGVFALIVYLGIAGNLLISAIGNATLPRIANLYSNKQLAATRTLMLRILSLVTIISGIGCFSASIFGRDILNFFYGNNYGQYSTFFTCFAFAIALSFIASILGYWITAMRCFQAQVPIQISTLLATASSCLILTPKFGLSGAAIGIAIGYFIQTCGSVFVLKRAMHKNHIPT